MIVDLMSVNSYTSLSDLFHRYIPPELRIRGGDDNQSTTRRPGQTTFRVFSTLPDNSLHVTHSPTILPALSNLLTESWTEEATTSPLGQRWETWLSIAIDHARHAVIQSEITDLSAIFLLHLFAPVNLVASRLHGALKEEAYPEHEEVRSAWTMSVTTTRNVPADHFATLSAIDPRSPILGVERVVVEKKLPKLTSKRIMTGVGVAARQGGFTIEFDPSGNGEYNVSGAVDRSFTDTLTQVRPLHSLHSLRPLSPQDP